MARQRKNRNVKIIFPSTITTFAMTFGFISILLATDGKIIFASYLILVAMIMDGLDGKVARITHTASEFGIQYDSLSDLVAFGVAPCVIYARFYLYQQVTDTVYYLLPIMFLVCGAIRLARFNITASIYGKHHFTGLPIPAAAFGLVAGPIFHRWAEKHNFFEEWGLAFYFEQGTYFRASMVMIVVLSVSMISALKFDTPETFWLRKFKIKPLNYLVVALFLSLWIFIDFAVFAVGITFYYLISMYGRALLSRINRIHKGEGSGEGEESNRGDETLLVEEEPLLEKVRDH